MGRNVVNLTVLEFYSVKHFVNSSMDLQYKTCQNLKSYHGKLNLVGYFKQGSFSKRMKNGKCVLKYWNLEYFQLKLTKLSINNFGPPWLWNPGQTSPEVQNRGISGPTKKQKGLMSSNSIISDVKEDVLLCVNWSQMWINIFCFVFFLQTSQRLPVYHSDLQHIHIPGSVRTLLVLLRHQGAPEFVRPGPQVPHSQICHLSFLLAR